MSCLPLFLPFLSLSRNSVHGMCKIFGKVSYYTCDIVAFKRIIPTISKALPEREESLTGLTKYLARYERTTEIRLRLPELCGLRLIRFLFNLEYTSASAVITRDPVNLKKILAVSTRFLDSRVLNLSNSSKLLFSRDVKARIERLKIHAKKRVALE